MPPVVYIFFFNDTATTEIYTLSLHDALPICLSSREGCGNTVRNVTGDPWAGVCENEVFDPTPYVGAYVRYFVRHPTTQLIDRKSTRLNSSHANISYAVFCLKKKKTTMTLQCP